MGQENRGTYIYKTSEELCKPLIKITYKTPVTPLYIYPRHSVNILRAWRTLSSVGGFTSVSL